MAEYRFPFNVPPQARWENGAKHLGNGGCALSYERDCTRCEDWEDRDGVEGTLHPWHRCRHATVQDVEYKLSEITTSLAKQLLRQFGGKAWMYKGEPDGKVRVIDITLTGE